MKLYILCSVNNITFLTSLIALSLSTFFLLDWHVFAEASRVILSGKDSIYRDNDQTHVSYTSVLPTTRLRVIPGTGLFTDGDSTYLFHGINVVYKGHNPVVVTPELVQFIIEHGFNAIRLGFLWTDVQPTYDYFNTTYLEILRNDIDELWSHGIRVILDLHQDCYSSYFCAQYDSLPDFITHPPNTTEYNQNGSRAFPLPMMHPKYDDAAEVDPSNPWGRITNCQELKKNGPLGWSSCYATFAMGKSTQRLYDNDDGAQDMFAEFWGRIAAYFKGHPGIVGYELLNEPWLGDVPLRVQDFNAVTNRKHWNLWSSGVADKKNLQPMYDRLQKAIREVDAEAVIFFEPATGGNILHAFPVGFEHGPGGSHYDVGGYNVLSYHVYCPWVQRDSPGSNFTDSKIKNWLKSQVAKLCEPMNGAQYAIRKHDIDRLQVGGWLTEFGDFPTDGRSHGLMNFVLSKMDEYFQSWSYWMDTYHNDYVSDDISYGELVRPYPMITWGRPETLKFDNRTMVMTYTFHTPRNPTSSNVTAIFLPPPAAGLAQHWSVDVTPDLFRGSLDVERSIYLLQPADDVATLGIEVSVTVLPAIIPPHWKLQ